MDQILIIPKLSYEILNTPIEELADNLGLSPNMLQDVIDKHGWVRRFPESNAIPLSPGYAPEGEEVLEGEDIFTVKADQFIDFTKKRLQLFNIAKTLALTESYARLEFSLIDKVQKSVDEIPVVDNTGISKLAAAFRTLVKDLSGLTSAVSFVQDESGLPTVILRDLSGS